MGRWEEVWGALGKSEGFSWGMGGSGRSGRPRGALVGVGGLTCSCRAVGSRMMSPWGSRAQVTPQKREESGSPASNSPMQAAFRQQARSWGASRWRGGPQNTPTAAWLPPRPSPHRAPKTFIPKSPQTTAPTEPPKLSRPIAPPTHHPPPISPRIRSRRRSAPAAPP